MIPSTNSGKSRPLIHGFLIATLILPLAFSSAASSAMPHAIAWTDKGPDAYIVHSLSPVESDPGIFISLNEASPTCASAIMVCGHSFEPMGVAEGGAITLRVGGLGFEAHYACQRVDGHMAWVQTGSMGSCSSAQVINIPATYTRSRIRNIG